MGLHPRDHIQPWERYPQGPGGPEEELLLALLVAQLNQGGPWIGLYLALFLTSLRHTRCANMIKVVPWY